jgi:hypothetical protein
MRLGEANVRAAGALIACKPSARFRSAGEAACESGSASSRKLNDSGRTFRNYLLTLVKISRQA